MYLQRLWVFTITPQVHVPALKYSVLTGGTTTIFELGHQLRTCEIGWLHLAWFPQTHRQNVKTTCKVLRTASKGLCRTLIVDQQHTFGRSSTYCHPLSFAQTIFEVSLHFNLNCTSVSRRIFAWWHKEVKCGVMDDVVSIVKQPPVLMKNHLMYWSVMRKYNVGTA